MSAKTLVCVLLVSCLCPRFGSAADQPIPTGKEKLAFNLKTFKPFIDFDLSRPKPTCSMRDMGIPGRRAEGQLVDDQGKPLQGVAVALVEPIGYSSHCYHDNFDITDDQGRFLVDGSVAKTRLVFRNPKGRIWKVNLRPGEELVRVAWPAAATVTLQVPADVAEVGQSLSIQTRRYWSGMAVMRQSAEVNADGVALFEGVIPGEYYVTATKEIEVAGKQQSRLVEVAQFTVEAGAKKRVACKGGDSVLTGHYAIKADPLLGNLGAFVLIERVQVSYEDQPPLGDLLNLDEAGKFESGPLSPGVYRVRVTAKSPAPLGARFGGARFGGARFGGGDRTLRSWQVEVDGSEDRIDLDSRPEPDAFVVGIDSVLQSAASATGRLRADRYVSELEKLGDRKRIEALMLESLSDPTFPYPQRRVIPEILSAMTDSPTVVRGLIDALEHPVSEKEQGAVVRAFQSSPQMVDEIVAALRRFVEDPNHITRSITIRALGELAVKHPEHADVIAKLLTKGLEDPWETIRSTAADYLGRIGSTDALPALLKASDDRHGPVAVMAAFSAWKISGDPEDFYPITTRVLSGEGVAGLWDAAYFMTNVAEKHPVPEQTQGALRRVATMAGKPPFRSTFEYEQSRAAKAAQKMLDVIAGSGAEKKN